MQRCEIKKCLNEELDRAESIIIGLQHQYHYNKARQIPTIDMLTGGDRALYHMLVERGDYNIELVSATIQFTNGSYDGKPTVNVLSPDTMTLQIPKCRTYNNAEDSETDEDAEPIHGVAVVVPSVVNREWILSEEWLKDDYGYRKEMVYLVSGLHVYKKVK